MYGSPKISMYLFILNRRMGFLQTTGKLIADHTIKTASRKKRLMLT